MAPTFYLWPHLCMYLEMYMLFSEICTYIDFTNLEMLNTGKIMSVILKMYVLSLLVIQNLRVAYIQILNATDGSLISWVRIAGGCLRLQDLLAQPSRDFFKECICQNNDFFFWIGKTIRSCDGEKHELSLLPMCSGFCSWRRVSKWVWFVLSTVCK